MRGVDCRIDGRVVNIGGRGVEECIKEDEKHKERSLSHRS